MANVKKFIGYTTTAKTVYGIIERQVDSYLLNDADGAFAFAPADPYVSFTEHSVLKGEYILSESRVAWNDGLYKSTVYEQAGGSPVPASDLVVAFQYMYILSDLEVVTDADVGAILVDTSTTIPSTLSALNDITVAEIIAGIADGTYDLQEMMRLIFAASCAKVSGGGTTTIVFRDGADSKNRITATVDANGNRTTTILDGT